MFYLRPTSWIGWNGVQRYYIFCCPPTVLPTFLGFLCGRRHVGCIAIIVPIIRPLHPCIPNAQYFHLHSPPSTLFRRNLFSILKRNLGLATTAWRVSSTMAFTYRAFLMCAYLSGLFYFPVNNFGSWGIIHYFCMYHLWWCFLPTAGFIINKGK